MKLSSQLQLSVYVSSTCMDQLGGSFKTLLTCWLLIVITWFVTGWNTVFDIRWISGCIVQVIQTSFDLRMIRSVLAGRCLRSGMSPDSSWMKPWDTKFTVQPFFQITQAELWLFLTSTCCWVFACCVLVSLKVCGENPKWKAWKGFVSVSGTDEDRWMNPTQKLWFFPLSATAANISPVQMLSVVWMSCTEEVFCFQPS